MTSRYLRFSAEQVTITPEGAGVVVVEGIVAEVLVGVPRRVERASSRRRMSQSHLSASVSGSPRAILEMFSGVWNSLWD